MPPGSSNPYDSVILPLVGEEKKASAGGYDAIIPRQEAEDPAMRASVSLAVDTNPAVFAEQRKHARTAGLPPAAGPALPDETKRLAAVDTIVKDTQDTPVLRQRYTDADFAKLSHTDSGVLASIERTMGKGLAFVMGANPEANLPDIVRGGAHWMAEGAAGVGRAAAGLATYFPGPLDALPGGNPFARLEEGFAMANQAERKKRLDLAAEWGDTWQGRVFGGGLESGIQSAVQNLPLAAGTAAAIYFGSPVAATVGASLLAMSALQGGQSYGETLDKGAGKGTALIHGLADTMAEYVGEKYWGFAGFMSNALAGASLTKLAVYELSKEVPGEMGTTIWQNFNEWAANNSTKSFMDFVLELPVSLGQTVVATLVGGGGQIGATHFGRGLLAEAARTAGLTDQAAAGADHLERLFEKAKESTLRKNDADTFKDLIQAIAEGNEGALKTVHVDAQALVDMSLSAGISQEAFNQLLPSAGPQMQEALAANSSVELPIGEVVANIPGSKLEPGFIDNVRVTPEALTRAEAAQTSDQAQAYWQSRADEVLKAAENAQATADSAEKVGKTILDQLTATKRFTAEVAQRYADLHKAFFTVMADRLGLTPEEVYQRYPLKVLSTLTNGQAYADNTPRRKPGEIEVEGFNFGKSNRTLLSGSNFGRGLAGNMRDQFLNAEDKRLSKRIYFYADKGTGINPEAGVGGIARKAQLKNIYDSNSDPLRLRGRPGGQLAFESAVLDAGFSGYLDRLEGNQSGQVIMLGDQMVNAELLGPTTKTTGKLVPPPAPRESKGRDIIIDKLAADKSLPAGAPTVERWQQLLPEDIRQAFDDAGVFDGDPQRTMYKSELAAAYAARTEAPVYGQQPQPLTGLPTKVMVDGKEVTFGPFEPARLAARTYAALRGFTPTPVTEYVTVDKERAARIAQAFEEMKHEPENPEVKAAYAALIEETLAQWQVIKATGLKVEFITGKDPYGNPRNAILDVVRNNHLWVYPTSEGFGGTESQDVDISGNPLLEFVDGETISGRRVQVNDIFRIVHDYFGHVAEGVGFRADGEENAWRLHSVMFSPLARKALTTETRGQNSWVNFGPYADFNRNAGPGETQYAPQKIGLLPQWVVEDGAPTAPMYEQSVSLRDGRETLKRYGLTPGKKYKTREVAAALEARQRAKYGQIAKDDRSPETAQKIAKWMVEEVMFEMEQPGASGVGWYSEKFQRALDIMAGEFPELATDKQARDLMTAIIAITSDGQNVHGNFLQALGIYKTFKETGQFATERGHQRQASIAGNLKVLQRLHEDFGPDRMHAYLLREMTVGQLKKAAKEAGLELNSDYQASIKMPMAVLEFGPKLGAFYANLMGASGYLTMDRWWSRTFNRYRGILLDAPTRQGLDRFKELLGDPSMSDDAAISATIEPTKAYEDKGFKHGTEIEKAANTLHKAAFDALNDAPFNATDRTFMLDTVARAQKLLARKGVEISVADIQAALWYYEKRLYGELGARQTADTSYEDTARRVVAERTAGGPSGPDLSVVEPGLDDFDVGAPSDVLQQRAEGPVLVNVGLDIPAGGKLTPAEVQAAIEAFGVKVETSAVHQSNTEQTFVGQLDRALTPDEADALSRALGQEAVVQMVGNEGALYGPEKEKWGDFNPDYFLTLKGDRASAALNQSAFHGTPHRFDKFSTEHIGRGEGAQAYGWGLYFASKKEIAEHYRKNLLIAKGVDLWTDELRAQLPPTRTKAESEEFNNLNIKLIRNSNLPPGEMVRWRELKNIATVRDEAIARLQPKGQLYEVDIPEDDTLLLWDKPLSEQPEKVREALKQVGVSFPEYALDTKRASSDFYLYIGDKLNSDKAASETLLAAGVRGIKYLDGTSRRAGAGSYNYVVFSGDDVAIKNQFYQNKPDPLGTFKPSTLEISLLADANLSTFLHETGHFFLEVLGRVANEPGAPKEVVDDLNATLKWFGVKDIETWNAMTFDEREPHHEKWAESFERYLLEGKAPSLALRQSFQRFKEFLIGAYRSLKQFIAGHPEAKLNDEVRSVFDRLLATEEQIKEAEAQARFEEIFKSAKDAGMTEEEWKAYQEKHQDATQAALEKMGKLSLADTKWFVAARSKALREAQAAVADKRAEMKAQVTAEVMALPVEQARAEIANLRASTPEQKAALKAWNEARAAALTQAKEQLTAALVAANPDAKGLDKGQLIAKNKRAIANQAEAKALEWEQSHPRPKTMPPPLEMEVLAERLGYTSADQLRREMIEAPAAKDLIEAMTDQRLLETYGNLVTREGIEQAANEAVYNEARGRFVATELGAMQDAMSKTGPSGKTNRAGKPINVNVITQAARTFAEAVVNRRRIMDLKPAQHTAAAARAAGKAAKLQAEGKTAEAIAAKRDQLLSHFTALYAFRAEKDVAQQLAYLKKFDKEGVRKSIPQDYLDQIDALLERVDLRKGTSAKEIGRRQDLAAWVEQQHEEGKSPILPPAALANSQLTSYKEMTVEDFAGLVDSIQNIEHLGRLKGKLLKSADKRAWDAIATEIADTIRKFGGKARPDSLEPRGPLTQLAAGFWADHRKLDSLAYQMDGGQLNGPMFRAFIRGMNDSGAFKASEIAKATEALARIYSPVWALPGGTAGDLKFIPEINNSLTRGGRLSVALNWGNAENRQRLLETGVGAPWSQAQVEAIMRTLSPTELQFVNNVWEFLDSFWPAVKAKQQRVSGVVEEKVEAVPFDVVASDGTPVHMRGGYYPIVYDNDRSNAAAKRDALQIAKDMLRGAIGAATTRRGHTKARVEEVKAQPLRLSLNVITQHVEQVVHDLAWHEWLIDANKILADKRIAAAIREHYGPAILKTMRENVKGIATGDLTSQTSLDQILLKLKSNLSRAVMGYSMTTALLQPFGVLQSVSRVGVAPILKGAGRWAGDAARMESSLTWIHEKSDFMRLRSQTMNREINDISQRVRGKSKTMQVIDHSLFVLMQKMQTVADVPTWIGMYERAQAEGYDEATSVALADEAVKASQGSGQPQDLANVQRKHPFLTMFYSYFSTTLNLVAEKTAMTDFKSPTAVAGWMADMALLVTLPAILPNLLAYVMKGGDDDDPEGWAKRLAKWQASYLLGLFVGLRELSGAVEGFDYAGPPVGRVLVDLTKTSQQLLQGELDEAAVTSIARTMGDIFGIPAAQLIRSYKGWQAWADGDAPITAVLMGPPPRD